MPRRPKYHVFISHSSADTWIAKQIAAHVTDSGASPFLDEVEIAIGGNFENEILAFLHKADELLVLLTPWALDCPYVWAELGAAWGKGMPIVGVLHGISSSDLQARPGMPVFLKKTNLVDINLLEKYFAELSKRCRSTRRKHSTS